MRNIEKLRRKLAARDWAYKARPSQQARARRARTLAALWAAEAREAENIRYHEQMAYQRSLDW